MNPEHAAYVCRRLHSRSEHNQCCLKTAFNGTIVKGLVTQWSYDDVLQPLPFKDEL